MIGKAAVPTDQGIARSVAQSRTAASKATGAFEKVSKSGRD